jgi:6-phosphogluconolactonase
VVVHADAGTLAEATAARLLVRLLDLQAVRRPVHVVLTGGTVGIEVLRRVAASPLRDAVDWSGVHVWWGDERFLPAGDPNRNETQAREALLDALGPVLPSGNVHPMAPLGPEAPDAATAARRYAAELRAHAPAGGLAPTFDVLLLGVGPDGHVASLFPGRSAMFEAHQLVVAETGSPKPPPARVSLTLPLIRTAREVWLVAAGVEKAAAVARALQGDDALPAARATGSERTLWLVDVAAAGALSEPSDADADGPLGTVGPRTVDMGPDGAGSSLATWAAVDDYASVLVDEPSEAVAMRSAAADAGLPDIAVSPAQGRLLEVLARAVGARRVLEIGTLGGYSTWWLARTLPDGGTVTTLEIDEAHAAVASASLAAAGVGDRVQVVVGPALDSLDRLVAEGAEPFDLVFVDADKERLAEYLERVVELVRPGALVVVDNVVRRGAVAEPDHPDERVQGVRRFVERAAADGRVAGTIVQTVGAKGYDGFALLTVL